MAKYLDPKNDVVFKRIFGEHPKLLVSLLNALIPLKKEQKIESVEYLPSEVLPFNPKGKRTVVDVRCKDNHGQQFLVEMQMVWNTRFENRMLYNTAKAYSRQLHNAGEYLELKAVYGLGILNTNFDHKTDKYYHHFQMAERGNPDKVLEGMEIVLVELKKFKPAAE
ncbi:MAG: Rpn family recombination-promoting nuclease/putative transposase, partial [Prevotellaceae bacterium]|nr:Rpn family recombination-promoting nuclease/putative transposase [Prevotellaceae bacterium]